MSAYKRLNKQDAYITTYVARKSWTVSGSEYGNYGIKSVSGLSGSEEYILDPTDLHKGQYMRTVYQSINHLYYSGFINGEPVIVKNDRTGSGYENYLQSSYNVSGSRNIGGRVSVFSIPRELIGTHIQPGSFTLTPSKQSTSSEYASESYCSPSSQVEVGTTYVEGFTRVYGSERDLKEDDTQHTAGYTLEDISPVDKYSSTIVDDGEGNLYYQYSNPRQYVGNIIYPHGQVIITEDTTVGYYSGYLEADLTWKSNHSIFTHNYHCKVKESELNHTFNTTALRDSFEDRFYNDGGLYISAGRQVDGIIANNLTGSEFQPYITTVGLYNDAHELVAVGKLSQPVPKSAHTDMTFILKIDT